MVRKDKEVSTLSQKKDSLFCKREREKYGWSIKVKRIIMPGIIILIKTSTLCQK